MYHLKIKVKAFTLVELIVVITILAILGTIAFINLQGYSTGARDSKRISDINNIQKKITIELSKGTLLSSLINTVKTNTGLTIDGNPAISIQGTANFLTLKENGDKFKDPVTKGDYLLSYSIGGTGTGAYKFTQIGTVNEENNQAVIKGNYYQMQVGDSPSITVNNEDYYVVDAGVDLPYIVDNSGDSSSNSSSGGPVVTYECNGLIGSANPDQRGDNYGYQDFDLCTNTIILSSLINIPLSSNLTNNPGAREVYAFVLEQGKTYTLESLGNDTDSDTAFFLYDNLGNKLAINDDLSNDIYRSSITYVAPYTGYYYLGVMGYDDGGTYADYTLSIDDGNSTNPVNGMCGSDNGKLLLVTPTNLCSKGTSSIVTDQGEGLNYTWTCDGINGGGNTSCSAIHKVAIACNYQQADIDALNISGGYENFSVTDENYNTLTTFPLTKDQWCSVTNLTWIGGANVTPEIFTLNLLTYLNLYNNGITTLPPEVGNLTSLTNLDLSTNSLTSLPDEIGNLAYLDFLGIGSNQLTSFPTIIGNLSNLTSLQLYNNKISSVTHEIGNLTNLVSLGLGTNLLNDLPSELWNLNKLTYLSLSSNQISSIPSQIGNLTNLTNLDLSTNQITTLPSEFSNLVNLKTLYYDNNQVVTIPQSIFSLSSLETLYMRSNLITTLPPDIGNLTGLTTLDFEANKITGIPAEFGNLINLSYLRIRNNKITSIAPEFSNLSSLTSLYIESNLLTTLPVEFGNLTSLISLFLDSNPLTSIPSQFGNLSSLRTLYLRNNQLTDLPLEFGNLTSLTTLHFGANPATSVPDAIFNLPNLKYLGLLDIHNIASIQPSISNLTNLISLDFRRASSLTTVPPEIGNLPNLEYLYFGNSALTVLPSEVGNLSKLKTLRAYNTHLTTLPGELTNLTSLTNFSLSGNSGLGQLNKDFGISSPNSSQVNIPTTGQTMTVGGNGTNVVVTVTP
ncbi:MAG: leucine-rich repeat domain-containing protein [Candidatus Gracilibacteria bacterium]|nr:leucine-rich repeat domain-containing protein [Candidatus Gracilibacteria bacterium]